MKTRLVCASHSPLMFCYKREPKQWDELQAAFKEQARSVDEFDPELVIAFGSDHFNGFFLKLMPAFCVGLQAEAVDDIGGFPGKLKVPGDLALQLAASLRTSNLDPAVSHQMTVDHAFSQTINLMLGGLMRVKWTLAGSGLLMVRLLRKYGGEQSLRGIQDVGVFSIQLFHQRVGEVIESALGSAVNAEARKILTVAAAPKHIENLAATSWSDSRYSARRSE